MSCFRKRLNIYTKKKKNNNMKIVQNTLKTEEKFSDVLKKFRVQ